MVLAELPTGSRILLRCKNDWRDATVVMITEERVTLLVCSPSGRSYRVRREPDEELAFDGAIPLLGEGNWKDELVRYDVRW